MVHSGRSAAIPHSDRFEFGVEDPADRCNFCQNEADLVHRDRHVPLFNLASNETIPCWRVQSFFDRVDVRNFWPLDSGFGNFRLKSRIPRESSSQEPAGKV